MLFVTLDYRYRDCLSFAACHGEGKFGKELGVILGILQDVRLAVLSI